MLPWPLPRWDASEEQAPEEQGPSPFGDPGKVRNSGGKALGEPGAPPQDSPQFRAPRPSWTRRGQWQAPPRAGLVAQQHPGPPGFPVMCCEDVFLSDPLLPPGQRVPLYLPEAPQQVMGSLKLLLPPPIMSPRVCPTRSPGCCTTWLSGPELIALTGLLQMSQGEPRPSSMGSSAAPTPPSDPLDPVSDHAGPSGSHCTDPSLRQTPETNCP
ncbi:Histone deacetylase complex subunit SAP25 [Myotis davidii]|uniref:Histone deacetylase complex subunit SAP25 n=1 Tax=Myotis davidii TaxID=225400 RepID=L5LSY1_MYODS|nr:Histone deacetylase complex subunit SAP25 [Myotis davidii]